MAERVYNFSPGPGMMPRPVLDASAKALVEYGGSGCGIAEVSHRGKEFSAVLAEAEERCRRLLGLGDEHAVLFLQGGATQQFEMLAMNFLREAGEYVVSGQWAKKAADAGARHGPAKVLASSAGSNYDRLPKGWTACAEADYLHVCTNNTIFGTRWPEIPRHPRLIADMSSEIMSRTIDPSWFAMIYAGAQKNLGPSGVVLAILRRDMLERCREDLPPIFSYRAHAEAGSCLNTPPTFGIYVLLETFRWLEEGGGIAAMEERNERKAALLYEAIDGSDGFYRGTVADPAERSRMNVTFTLADEDHTADFIAGAAGRGMVALKGYRTVGGIRASIYNAMPVEGCEALATYMEEFRRN